MTIPGYDGLSLYYGGIHNHRAVSCGHGPAAAVYENAGAQLDFASVTAHAHWPDIPRGDARLAALVASPIWVEGSA